MGKFDPLRTILRPGHGADGAIDPLALISKVHLATPLDLLVKSSRRIQNGGGGKFALAPGFTSQTEARPAED